VRWIYVRNVGAWLMAALGAPNKSIVRAGDLCLETIQLYELLCSLRGIEQRSQVLPVSVARIAVLAAELCDWILYFTFGKRSAPFSWLQFTRSALLHLRDADSSPKVDEWLRELDLKLPFPDEASIIADINRLKQIERWPQRLPHAHNVDEFDSLRVMQPVKLGRLQLRNSIVKAATFDGMSRNGVPTPQFIEFHRDVARSGVALITVSYCAISPEGRSFGNQLSMDEKSIPVLRELTAAVHEHGALISAQLTHAGAMSMGKPILALKRTINPLQLRFTKHSTVADLEAIIEHFAQAAIVARDCGFDAVEIHCGHGYLLSQSLSPSNNRNDRFGGSFENRMHLPLSVLEAVKRAVPELAVIVKYNLEDGVASQLQINESTQFALEIQRRQLADALVPSGGMVLQNGFYMLRGEIPFGAMMSTLRMPWLKPLAEFFGPIAIPRIPFSSAFFLDAVLLQRSKGLKLPIIYTGGVHDIWTAEAVLHCDGVEAIGMARALLNDPELVEHWRKRDGSHQTCDLKNRCVNEATFAGKPLVCLKRVNAW
jgi:2,4-dienoyl-CoA reductase-like NADH-dependent reductase (Old Yellow Enzyme family)